MKTREFWTFMAPSLIVMFGLLVVPLYMTIQWSFQDVNYGSPGTWVGLDNYQRAFSDQRFLRSLVFTTGLTLTTTAVVVVLGYDQPSDLAASNCTGNSSDPVRYPEHRRLSRVWLAV